MSRRRQPASAGGMTIHGKPKLHKYLPLMIVLAAAIFVRALVYCLLPARAPAFSDNLIYYHQALTQHLGQYLRFATLKPPLTYLIHSATFRLFGLQNTHVLYINLLVVFVMDCAAVILLYLACLRLSINRFLAGGVLLIYSVAYVPWELMWEGSHYDHHTLLLTSVFIYCLVRAVTERSRRHLVMVSISAGLLVGQSTVNALSAPAAIVMAALVISLSARRRWPALCRDAAVGLIGPIIVVGGLCVKNYLAAGVVGTSNLAGPAAMMVVQKAMDLDDQRVREFLIRCDAPRWYLWAYDNAVRPIMPNGKPYPWPVSKAFGICYERTKLGAELWPHDFRPLHRKLVELGEKDLAASVEKDMADARHRPYLFAGFSPELSPRWIGRYGRVSVKVYRGLIVKEPGLYLAAVRRCHKVFWNYGSRLPRHIMRKGARTLPEPVPLETFLTVFARAFQWLSRWGYRLLYLGWLAALVAWAVRIVSKRRKAAHAAGDRWASASAKASADESAWAWLGPFAVLSAPALLMTAIFSCMVGAENNRYFLQISPYLMLIFPFCLTALLVGGRVTYTASQPAAEQAPDELEYAGCDLCGSDQCAIYLEGRTMRPLAQSDFTVLGEQGEHPQLVSCSRCGLIYANPRDAGKALAGKYEQMSVREYLLEAGSRRITAAEDAEFVKRYVGGGRLLDIGCSAGLFLDSVGDEFECYGIEPCRASAALAKKLIGQDRIHAGALETADLPHGSFHAVTMWDVIEHLASPRAALEKAASLLKEGGFLFLSTPDISSLFARALGHRWPHLIRSHLYYFNNRTLRKMLRRCGFGTVCRRTYSRKFTIRYLLERVRIISPRSGQKDSAQPGGRFSLLNISIPVNFFDTFVVVARKVADTEPPR
ncbi:MAG: methyltransferase domain-containing protein [Phycisphaerae bacterium]|nr:methyltransferase domain-containing protein [Phycisphaerae bacterium]